MTQKKNPLKPRDTVELNCNRNFDFTYRPFSGGASVVKTRTTTPSAPLYIVPVDLRAYIR